YVAWNVHEPEVGRYNFEGDNDLVEFIKLADSLGLLVILRPGPYICGEWDLGGFPGWLLKDTSMILRSSKDQAYINAVDKWMGVLLPLVKPLLYANGGPIISVQVENEYGSYYTCDHDYMSHLEILFRQHLGNDTILFTTDGFSKRMLECGSLPSLFTTVDFGAVAEIPFQVQNGGANASQFQPQPTSYDYDAPLNEAGDPTQKYFVLLEVIESMWVHHRVAPPSTLNCIRQKAMYMSSLLDALSILSPLAPINAPFPLTMEVFGQNHGFALYETQIPEQFHQSTVTINIPNVRDRAIIYVGKIRQATISRTGKPTTTLTIGNVLTLSILIENMGHVNYGLYLFDPKGIIGNVSIDTVILTNWMMRPLNLSNILGSYYPYYQLKGVSDGFDTPNAPTFFTGDIPPSTDGIAKDTYLRLKNWNKGQVFINGFNLGRYWTAVGPQDTLYIPASLLYSGQQASKLVILELDQNPCDYPTTCFVTFQDTPILNGPVKPLADRRHDIAKPSKQWIAKYTQDWDSEGENMDSDLRKAIQGIHRGVL
ncbi:hypothetical protein QZH41_008606, partial [Actinostola sp. cb2023]